MIVGMKRRTGFVCPVSQFPTVHSFTPSCVANSPWVSPRMSLRLRTCSPKVVGSKSRIGRIKPLPERDQPCRPLPQGLGRGSNPTFAPPVSSFRECAAPFAARTFPRIPVHITCAQYGSLPIPDRSLPAPDSPAFPGAAHALTGGPVDGGLRSIGRIKPLPDRSHPFPPLPSGRPVGERPASFPRFPTPDGVA